MRKLHYLILCVLAIPIQLNAQTATVKGRVSDANGTLPGATVQVVNGGQGTTTDIDGSYTLQDIALTDTLEVSYIGYQTRYVPINGNSTVNVEMLLENNSLDEIVVVGYGTQSRKEISTSISSVNEEDFNEGGVKSPLELVQGKVAGLNITRTQGANPNAGTSIQLRGVASLTGATSPLIVIDGIPGGNLDLIQQDDIESIDVLKDGSAAAIYGTRANSGVILITTKKGRKGAPQYNYNNYFQREYVDERPNNLSASEFRSLIDQGVITVDQDFGSSTDLYEELINNSNLSQYHNLAASGGGEYTTYRASLYYQDGQGIAYQNNREEFGGRLSIAQTGLQDKLTMQANVAGNFNLANLLGGGTGDFEQAVQRNPTAPFRNEDGTFYETQAYNNYNPLSRLAHRISERNQETFSGDVKLDLEIMEGLTASAFGSYVRDTWNDRYYRSTQDWDQRPTSSYQGTAYASKTNNLGWTKTFESTIEYDKDLTEDHSLNVIGGYSYQYGTYENMSANNNGFTTDGFLDWNLGAGSAIQNDQLPRPGLGSFKDDNTLVAFFGRANYSFRDRYFLQLILRREGSSRFGENNKWGSFPAASVAWVLSEEDFLENSQTIGNLKLRAGYGVTGNQGIPNYQSLVTLSTGGVYPQDGVYYQTYGGARNPNPDLRWEEKGELNIGVDFSLSNNKLGGSIDYFNRLTSDLLYNYLAPQPPYLRDRLYTNVGALKNNGIELYLNSQPYSTEDFTWDIDFTGTYQTNELDQLSNENFQANWLEFGGLPSPGNLGNAIRVEEGGRVGNFYGKRFAGFNDEGKWLFYKADGSTGLASEMNENDLTIIGNGVPDYFASLTNTFRYKDFDLRIFFRGKFGYDILNTKELYFGNKKWLPNNVLESAVNENAELDDDPQYSDYYLEKGDFVKLDNVTLGYNLPMNNDYIRNLRIMVTGRNLLTFSGYSGLDPEVEDNGFTTGIDGRSFYPRTNSLMVGLNVGF